jgi:hypothetical protein
VEKRRKKRAVRRVMTMRVVDENEKHLAFRK